jgi:hypothetical protein
MAGRRRSHLRQAIQSVMAASGPKRTVSLLVVNVCLERVGTSSAWEVDDRVGSVRFPEDPHRSRLCKLLAVETPIYRYLP